jgi:RHS repeat-associated protein
MTSPVLSRIAFVSTYRKLTSRQLRLRSWRNRVRSRLPRIEELEDRRVLEVGHTFVNGRLSVDDAASAINIINLSVETPPSNTAGCPVDPIYNALGRQGTPVIKINNTFTNVCAADVREIYVYGASGNDQINLSLIRLADLPKMTRTAFVVFGGPGSDTIQGSEFSETIRGGDGDDWIYGNVGDDVIFGDAGTDRIYGGIGHDRLSPGRPGLGTNGPVNVMQSESTTSSSGSQLQSLSLKFDQSVTISPDALSVYDEFGHDINLNSGGFSYDDEKITATWTFAAGSIDAGVYTYSLDETLVRNSNGQGLDGDGDEITFEPFKGKLWVGSNVADPKINPEVVSLKGNPHSEDKSLLTSLEVKFDKSVGTSIDASDLTVKDLKTGGIVPATSVSYSDADKKATFVLATPITNKGFYAATISGNGIEDSEGNKLAGDNATSGTPYVKPLLVTFKGDLNLDGYVSEVEASTVISNVGTTSATWADGDFSGDQVVAPQDAIVSVNNVGLGVGAVVVQEEIVDGGLGNDSFEFDNPVGTQTVRVFESLGYDTVDLSRVATGNGQTFNLGSFTNAITQTGSTKRLDIRFNELEKIERLVGTNSPDTLTGDQLSNTIDGLGGNDVILGLDGSDVILGSAGDDVLTGGVGNDSITGGLGNDLYAYSGSVALGHDTIVEAPNGGIDVLDFSSLTIPSGVILDLNNAERQMVVSENGAAFLELELPGDPGIENVIGSGYNDLIAGNALTNVLDGGAGDDALYGLTGSDTLRGGLGRDTLRSGSGTNEVLLGQGDADNPGIIDDLDDAASFESGAASCTFATVAFNGRLCQRSASAPAGSPTRWIFSGLEIGRRYDVRATWPLGYSGSTNTQFIVTTENTGWSSRTVDQTVAPTGVTEDGVRWQSIVGPIGAGDPNPVVVGADGKIIVEARLPQGSVGSALADAIRVVLLPPGASDYVSTFDALGSVFDDSNGNGIQEADGFSIGTKNTIFLVDTSASGLGQMPNNSDMQGSVHTAYATGASNLLAQIRLTSSLPNSRRVAIVPFNVESTALDMNFTSGSLEYFADSFQDADDNEQFDVDELIQALPSFSQDRGTNFEKALKETIRVLEAQFCVQGQACQYPNFGELNIIVLTDGLYPGTNFGDELQALRSTWHAAIRVAGAGREVNLANLLSIDPSAREFQSFDQFRSIFGLLPAAPSELARMDWRVDFDTNGNGVRDPREIFTYTDARGLFDFAAISLFDGGYPGDEFSVRTRVNSGYHLSTPFAGKYDVSLSSLVSGATNYAGLQFGVSANDRASGAISGFKYKDDNENGIRDISGLVAPDVQDLVFLYDASGSTSANFAGRVFVPNMNYGPSGDSVANTIFDAELASLVRLSQYLTSGVIQDVSNVRLAVAGFDDIAPSFYPYGNALDPEIIAGHLAGEPIGGSTNYEAGLLWAINAFIEMAFGTSGPRKRHLVFLSDGYPNGGDYSDEAAILRAMGVSMTVVGVGRNAGQAALDAILPADQRPAPIFQDPSDLITYFEGTVPTIPFNIHFTEEGLANWEIRVYRDMDADGEISVIEKESPVGIKQTDQQGNYVFDNLVPGMYLVEEIQIYPFRQTGPQSLAGYTSSVTLVTEGDITSYKVYLEAGDRVGNLNFGNHLDAFTNRPPSITSVAPTEVFAEVPMEFLVTGTDPDNDDLVFGVANVVWPEGYAPDNLHNIFASDEQLPREQGRIQWRPSDELVGSHVQFDVIVSDSVGNRTTQSLNVLVRSNTLNQNPQILTTPPTHHTLPQPLPPSNDPAVEPDRIVTSLGESQIEEFLVRLDPSQIRGTADLIFIVDKTDSMNGALRWLGETLPKIEIALNDHGISDNRYGLVSFGDPGVSAQSFGTVPDTYFTSVSEVVARVQAWADAELTGEVEEGYEAILEALDGTISGTNTKKYATRPGAARRIILVSDDQTFEHQEGDITFQTLRNDIVNKLLNGPDSADDIAVTSIVPGHVGANHSEGNLFGFVPMNGDWTLTNLGAVGTPRGTESTAMTRLSKEYWEQNRSLHNLGFAMQGSAALVESDASYAFRLVQDDFRAPGCLPFSGCEINHELYVRMDSNPNPMESGEPSLWTMGYEYGDPALASLGQSVSFSVPAVSAGQSHAFELRYVTDRYDGTVLKPAQYDLFVDGVYKGSLPFMHAQGFSPIIPNSLTLEARDGAVSFESVSFRDFDCPSDPVGIAFCTDLSPSYHPTPLLSYQLFFAVDFSEEGHTTSDLDLGIDIRRTPNGPAPGAVFSVRAGGEFFAHDNGVVLPGFPDVTEDYYFLSDVSAGSIWNITQLRNSNTPESFLSSFSNAFSLVTAQEVLEQLLPTVVRADDPSFVGATLNLNEGLGAFDVTLRGDGRAHNFSLEFAASTNSPTMASIPVEIRGAYTVEFNAVDPDGDSPLTFRFTPGQASHGAELMTSGLHANLENDRLIWHPESTGEFTFFIEVSDVRGGRDEFSWTVNVTQEGTENSAPVIESVVPHDEHTLPIDPRRPLVAVASRAYEFAVQAVDSNGDRLRYYLEPSAPGEILPSGMRIDRNNGVVTWLPGDSNIGQTVSFTVLVSDGRFYRLPNGQLIKGETRHTFSIDVAPYRTENSSPVFSSSPRLVAIAGERYDYTARAYDLDSDARTYSLDVFPDGMVIDAATGQLAWTPAVGQIGDHGVTIVVSDGRGGITTQSFVVQTLPANDPPRFTSSPPAAVPGSVANPQELAYELIAMDPNGDMLQFTLVDGPADARIENRLVGSTMKPFLAWPTRASGIFRFSVAATDPLGASDRQDFDIEIGAPVLVDPIRTEWSNTSNSTQVLRLSSPAAISSVTLNADAMDRQFAVGYSLLSTTNGILNYQINLAHTPTIAGLLGSFPLELTATNTLGLTTIVQADAQIQRKVPGNNLAPLFLTERIGALSRNQAFAFPIQVADQDGDVIASWSIVADRTTASGTSIDSMGVLQWTPSSRGYFEITVRATDTGGASTDHTFVTWVRPNARPTVERATPPNLYVGQPFAYDITFRDPNGDAMQLYLDQGSRDAGFDFENIIAIPNGVRATLTSTSHTATRVIPGTNLVPVEIAVGDSAGAITQFSLRLEVYDPASTAGPTLFEMPQEFDVFAGRPFELEVAAANPRGNALTFQIASQAAGGSIPQGLSISERGKISWTPSQAQLGSYGLKVLVDDERANTPTAVYLFTVNVRQLTQNPDRLPGISTVPPLAATAGEAMVYRPRLGASPLRGYTWSLDRAPEGMTIDAQTGRVIWTPSPEVIGHEFPVSIRVADARGASTHQRFTLGVNANNARPEILNSFPSTWVAARPFNLTVFGADPERHAIRYEILTLAGAPITGYVNLTMNGDTGVLQWPSPTAGVHGFAIRVSEVEHPESFVERQLVLDVKSNPADAPNLEPYFIDNPRGKFAAVGQPFSINLLALTRDPDPNNAGFLYNFVSGNIAGMQLGTGASNGIFQWTPTASQIGVHAVTIRVTDIPGQGGVTPKSSYLAFLVQVGNNDAPVISSENTLQVAVGNWLTHQVVATDPENGDVIFALEGNPTGYSIDANTGVFRWLAPNQVPATQPSITVLATDELGAVTRQTVTITVLPDIVAPVVSLSIRDKITRKMVLPSDQLVNGRMYVIQVSMTDNLPGATWTMVLTDSSGDACGFPGSGGTLRSCDPSWTGPAPAGYYEFEFSQFPNQGNFEFAITATDTAQIPNRTQRRFNYYADDPVQGSYAKIVNPVGGEIIRQPLDIYAVVNGNASGQMVDYELRLYPIDDFEDYLVVGKGAIAGNETTRPLGRIDPALVETGLYRLNMRVTCLCGEGTPPEFAYLGLDERILEIRNGARHGSLDLAFTDLQTDLGGIPISLSRSYSTSRAFQKGDFGQGWWLDFLHGGIEVSHQRQVTTSLTQPFALGTRVQIRLPDGRLQRFTFDPLSLSGQNTGPFSVDFRPDYDTSASLQLRGTDPNLSLLKSTRRSDGTFVVANTDLDFIPYVVGSEFVLRSLDGVEYHFAAETGELHAVVDPSGRRVDISTTTETIASQPRTVHTLRTRTGNDAEVSTIRIIRVPTTGLVERIEDPKAQPIHYGYSTVNINNQNEYQLSLVTARDAKTSSYLYSTSDPDIPHHLVGILNHEQVRILNVDYFTQGESANNEKLGQIQDLRDASNAAAGLQFDVALGDGRYVSRVDNPQDLPTDIVKDARGNVVRRVQHLDDESVAATNRRYLVTVMKYNLRSLVTAVSTPFIVVGTSNRYDQNPASPPETGIAPEWARRVKYNAAGLEILSMDALGNASSTEYDDRKRPIRRTDPNGLTTHSIYDPVAHVLIETYSTYRTETTRYNWQQFEYDPQFRLVGTLQVPTNYVDGINPDPRVRISQTSYDSHGRVSSTVDVRQNTQYFRYDDNGNQVLTYSVWSEPSGSAQRTLASRTVFDNEGRAVSTHEYEIPGDESATLAIVTVETFDSAQSPVNGNQPLGNFRVASEFSVFDSEGRVSSSIDRFGKQSITTYDQRGLTIESRTQSQGYNTSGVLVTGWLVTRTAYDAQGRTTFVSDPYFSASNLPSLGNGATSAGIVWQGTRTVYDLQGRAWKTERHDGVRIDLVAVDADTSPTVEKWQWQSEVIGTSTRISHTETIYDVKGRVEATINELGARSDSYYDITGRQYATLGPVVTVAGLGQVRHLTETNFDPAGRTIQSRVGIAITDVSNPHPDITNSTIRNESRMRTTFTEFDSAGRQSATISTRIVNPYFVVGGTEPAQIHLRTESDYDVFGRRIEARDGLVQTDPFQSSTISRTRERATNYGHDAAGALSSVTLPWVAHPTKPGNPLVRPRYEYTMDNYGNQTATRDNTAQVASGMVEYDHDPTVPGDDSRITRFTFDHRNRQTSRTLPLGVDTTTNANDFVERMVYDDRALTVIPLGDRGTSSALGQLKYSVDFEGRVTAYLYDNASFGGGRLVGKYFYATEAAYLADASDNILSLWLERVTYTFDEYGRERTVTFDHGGGNVDVTTKAYDPEGRLISEQTVDSGVTYTVSHQYNRVTGQKIRTFTNDTDTRYVFDSLGRVEKVVVTKRFNTNVTGANATTVPWADASGVTSSITGEVTDYDFDLVGNLDATKLPNGMLTDYVYDELNRLDQQITFHDGNGNGEWNAGETIYGQYDYLTDIFHKRVQSLERDASNKQTKTDWTFDGMGRLVSEQMDYDTANPAQSQDYLATYKFDLVGNRRQKEVDKLNATGVDEAFSLDYDRNDRLLTETQTIGGATITAYEYDNGNGDTNKLDGTAQTRKVVTSSGSVTRTSDSAYDRQGRLKQSIEDINGATAGGQTTYQYEYTADGVRISQTTDGVKTIYVVDATNPTGYTQVVEEKSSTGQVTKTYTIGLDVHSQAVMVAAAQVVHHLLTDGHGSTRALFDNTRALLQNSGTPQLFAYDAYGNLLNLSGYATAISQALTSLLYSGEQTDRTGLQQLRARYYDALNGRFHSTDPFAGNFSDPLSLHKYLYTHGDPVNGVDPSGEWLQLLAMAWYYGSIGLAAYGALDAAERFAEGGFSQLRWDDALFLLPGLGYFGSVVKYGRSIARLQSTGVQLATKFPSVAKRLAAVGGELQSLAGRSRSVVSSVAGTQMHQALRSTSLGRLVSWLQDLVGPGNQYFRVSFQQPLRFFLDQGNPTGDGSSPDITFMFPKFRFAIVIDLKPVPQHIWNRGYAYASDWLNLQGGKIGLDRNGTHRIMRDNGMTSLYFYLPYPSLFS